MPGPSEFLAGRGRIALEAAKLWEANPPVELFGHVTLVQGYQQPPTFVGCHALVALRDTPGKTAAVLTAELGLQSLLETALATGNLIAFEGTQRTPTPPGWTVDGGVFDITSVILYSFK
jgi:hypothetical protein